MTIEERLRETEAENTAMRSVLKGRANKARNLRPRDAHPGYRVIAKREGEFLDVRGGVVQARRDAFICDVETPFPVEQRILPFKETIRLAVAKLAAEGDYIGAEPKVFGLKMVAPRGALFWVATVFYSGEWAEITSKGGEQNEHE